MVKLQALLNMRPSFFYCWNYFFSQVAQWISAVFSFNRRSSVGRKKDKISLQCYFPLQIYRLKDVSLTEKKQSAMNIDLQFGGKRLL